MLDYSHIKGLDIICDTNILIDLSKAHLEVGLSHFITSLMLNENNLQYSNYSIFEFLRGQPKKLIQDYEEILELFDDLEVSENHMIIAAQLMSLYKHHNLISDASTSKKNPSMIDDGDYIIAATAFSNKKTAILTRNYSDFPRPFFNEACKHYLEYEKEGKKGVEIYYVLTPDLPYVNKMYHLIN